jgi:hypothetical protein
MKTAVYFPVSTTHYSSTLSLNIRRTKGWQGYGQYIAILQMLANSKTRKLQLSEVPDIAFNLHISEEEVLTIINSYFIVDGNEFGSAELEEALSYFDAKYNAASEAGKKSAAMLTPEQRKEKAKKAIETRWNKSGNTNTLVSENTNPQYADSPKVILQEDTNTLVSVSIDTNKPQYDTNNKIKENKIEEKRKEENKKEQPSASDFGVSVSSAPSSPSVTPQTTLTPQMGNEEKSQTSRLGYDGIAIQYEINNHTPMYFTEDNVEYLTSIYNEHKKQINTPMDLKTYEKVLYFQILLDIIIEAKNNNTPIERGNLNNTYVNDYVTNKQPNIVPGQTEQLFTSVKKDKQMNVNLKSIINDPLHQLPKK